METKAKTLCRRDGPETSRDAAEKMVESGALNRQEQEVYDTAFRYIKYSKNREDFTTKDIAGCMWCNYGKAYDICRKRFSGLENKGKIELTGDRRDGCRVWRLK